MATNSDILDNANMIRFMIHNLRSAAYLCHVAEMSSLILIMFCMSRWSGIAFRCLRQYLDFLRGVHGRAKANLLFPTKMIRLSYIQYKRYDSCIADASEDPRADQQVVISSEVFEFSNEEENTPEADADLGSRLAVPAAVFGTLPFQSQCPSLKARSEDPPGIDGEDSGEADALCIVCTERAPDAILVDCGHR
jgi:hypothetical protein